jgi:hypothetical protein
MSLFPTDDILARLQEQWKGYADTLRQEDKEAFLTMIEKCYAHAAAINAKGEPFPNEALLVSLVFSQYKMINWLVPKVAELSAKLDELEKEGLKTAVGHTQSMSLLIINMT